MGHPPSEGDGRQEQHRQPGLGLPGRGDRSSLTPGHVQRQLVANGEVLARYGDAPTQEENTEPSNNPVYVDTADFRMQAAQIRPRHKSMTRSPTRWWAAKTLKDIARNVLGDASLWWRLAEANSLAVSGDGALTAGQTLTVPKLSLNANSVETFQPYDPSQAMGSMDPVLPVPANGGGCGGIGAIIMVVVAVVVSIYTAGLLSGASGSLLTTMQAGMGVMSGGMAGGAVGSFVAGGMSTMGLVGTAAAAGAVGSIASQMVGNAIGAQDGFSWKSVALSALSSGVTSGLGASGWLPNTDSAFINAAAKQAMSSTISQGIGTVTGLQQRFDWKAVAAGAVGAGVGASVGQALQSGNVFGNVGSDFATVLARGTVSGFAAGLTTAVMHGGRISVQQVATDAFGNAIGEALVDYASSPGTPAQETMPSAQEAFRASEIAYRNATDPVDMGGAYGLQVGRSRYGFGISGSSLSEWSNEVDGGIMINGSLAPEQGMLGQAVVSKNQGPIAALAAAGLDAAQQQAMYGQMLAKGTIRLNAQGVPQVQPGQVLEFDLSDMSAGKLGTSAIGQESRLRSERVTAAAQAATLDAQRDISGDMNLTWPTAGKQEAGKAALLDPKIAVKTNDSLGDWIQKLNLPADIPGVGWLSPAQAALSAQYWAGKLDESGNPLYAIPQAVAQLWSSHSDEIGAVIGSLRGVSSPASRIGVLDAEVAALQRIGKKLPGANLAEKDPYSILIQQAEKISTAKSFQSTAPRDMQEQVVWNQVVLSPGGGKPLPLSGDPRFAQDAGFNKMEFSHRLPDGTNISVHYQYNVNTGRAYDMKIVTPQPVPSVLQPGPTLRSVN